MATEQLSDAGVRLGERVKGTQHPQQAFGDFKAALMLTGFPQSGLQYSAAALLTRLLCLAEQPSSDSHHQGLVRSTLD